MLKASLEERPMPDTKPTLTPERLRELLARVEAYPDVDCIGVTHAVLLSLLDAAEERDRLQSEMRKLRRTVAKHHGTAIAAIEERDRLQVELDELKAFGSKSELAMAEDWRLATTAAVALKDERDMLRARVAELEEAAGKEPPE
jgi:flagellar biosynthesis component FlhA